MWYIEKLLYEVELSLDESEKNMYEPIEIDLTNEQINMIKKQLKKLYADLDKVKKFFGLEFEPIKLSRIIDTNTGFIWETIEDTWPSKMEKTSGKINSDDKKKQIDEMLTRILKLTNKIREAAKYETF